jgi:hypothetical protein
MFALRPTVPALLFVKLLIGDGRCAVRPITTSIDSRFRHDGVTPDLMDESLPAPLPLFNTPFVTGLVPNFDPISWSGNPIQPVSRRWIFATKRRKSVMDRHPQCGTPFDSLVASDPPDCIWSHNGVDPGRSHCGSTSDLELN